MKDDPVLKIIERSGNGFHLKVSDHLKSLGWDVCIGQYYSDPATGKPREIDILANKKFRVGDSGENLSIRLFIECKYVSEENAVWFIDKDLQKTESLISDNRIASDCEEYVSPLRNSIDNKPHHYLKGDKVAKLTAKNGNTDIFYDGMSGCLHSLISLEGKDYETYRLDYPLIVLSSFDKIYRVTPNEDNPYEVIKENFQLAADYSYLNNNQQVNRYFLIDVVSSQLLTEFLNELETADIEIAKGLIISEIRKRRFYERQQRSEDSNFDPFSITSEW